MRSNQTVSWLVALLVVAGLAVAAAAPVTAESTVAGSIGPGETGDNSGPSADVPLCQIQLSPLWPYFASEEIERLLEISYPVICGSTHWPQ